MLRDQADGVAEYVAALNSLADPRPSMPWAGPAASPRRFAGSPFVRPPAIRPIRPGGTLARLLADVAAELPRLAVALAAAESDPPASQGPLFVPDAADPAVLRDAVTGAPATAAVPTVPWWPRLPADAVTAGVTTFAGVSAAALNLRPAPSVQLGTAGEREDALAPVRALIGWAQTLVMLRSREAGWTEVTAAARGGGSDNRRSTRTHMRYARSAYRGWIAFISPLGDQLTTTLGAYVSALETALTAVLNETGVTMPTLTGSSAVVSSLATRIRDAITAGHGGRLVVSEAEQAFSWAPGLPTSLLTYLAPQIVDGRRTSVTTAKSSATPADAVAEGGAKPDAVAFESEDVNLTKFGGQATIPVESAMFVRNIEPAIANVIGGQIVRAIEADAVAAMQANAGIAVADAADIAAGVLSASAQIRAAGGNPNAVALSVNDFVTAMSANGGGNYLNFASPEAGPTGLWLGLAPCIVPGLADGTAVVVDGRAAPIGEVQGGPLCIVDPFTQAKNNKIVITIETWAVPMVTSPGGVATVTVAVTP
jgi:hypothetical protein